MGSSFFKKAINPMSALDIPGQLAGKNSWLARMTSYDPLMQTGVGKVLAPNMYAKGQEYSQRNTDMNPAQTAAMYPTPYAGINPTLAGANAGYVTAAQKAAQQNQQNSQNQNNSGLYGY